MRSRWLLSPCRLPLPRRLPLVIGLRCSGLRRSPPPVIDRPPTCPACCAGRGCGCGWLPPSPPLGDADAPANNHAPAPGTGTGAPMLTANKADSLTGPAPRRWSAVPAPTGPATCVPLPTPDRRLVASSRRRLPLAPSACSTPRRLSYVARIPLTAAAADEGGAGSGLLSGVACSSCSSATAASSASVGSLSNPSITHSGNSACSVARAQASAWGGASAAHGTCADAAASSPRRTAHSASTTRLAAWRCVSSGHVRAPACAARRSRMSPPQLTSSRQTADEGNRRRSCGGARLHTWRSCTGPAAGNNDRNVSMTLMDPEVPQRAEGQRGMGNLHLRVARRYPRHAVARLQIMAACVHRTAAQLPLKAPSARAVRAPVGVRLPRAPHRRGSARSHRRWSAPPPAPSAG